ncbi:MAG: hypothetical protein HRT68_01495 [Flavobacteriaceae bacterium]|nr:hypothetical protein [Flavobacteriaceae bacterium]
MKKLFFLAICIALALVSCESSDDDNNNSSDEYYLNATINGEPVSFGFSTNATQSDHLMFGTGVLTALCPYTYPGGFYPNLDESLPTASFDFTNFYQGPCSGEDEVAVFNTLFPVGSYPYVNNPDTEIGVDFNFSYVANGNTYYTSSDGDQTGSTFNITSSEEFNFLLLGDLYSFNQIVTGTFSCTLYNANDPSDTLEVTNGTFRLFIEAGHDGFLN